MVVESRDPDKWKRISVIISIIVVTGSIFSTGLAYAVSVAKQQGATALKEALVETARIDTKSETSLANAKVNWSNQLKLHNAQTGHAGIVDLVSNTAKRLDTIQENHAAESRALRSAQQSIQSDIKYMRRDMDEMKQLFSQWRDHQENK